MRRRSIKLLEKSEAAMIAAIEIYNKPDFKYREETFALLALNAWELFLKAKILEENNNDVRSIYEREQRKKKDGAIFAGPIREEKSIRERHDHLARKSHHDIGC